MSGFLGSGDVQATGSGFLGSDPAPQPSGVAANIAGLDDILASEGAQRVKPILQAIIGQESGGNAGVGSSVDGAQGVGQIMPATFKQFAKPGERIDNPSDNLRVAARLVNHLYDKAGGDPGKIAAGYFSGEGNIGTERAYKTDHADGNGKRVSSYVSDVLGRMGAGQPAQAEEPAQEPQQPAITGPKWSEVVQRPSFQKMTPAERELARSEYFNRYLAPNIPEEEQQTARATFIERSKGMDPKEPGMFDGIAETLGGIRHAIRQAAGTLPEQIAADKERRRDQAGVMSGMDGVKSGPDFSDLPVTPGYLRAMQAQWNAATPAQREQMATRKDHMGIVAQRMNVDRADFKPTDASDVFDKTAEARTRRLIQNGLNGNDAAAIGRSAALRDMTPGDEQGMARAEVSNFDFEAQKKFNSDPFWSHAAVRGAVKGYEGFKQGYIGVNQAIGDVLGVDTSGQAELGRESRSKVDAMGERGDYLQRNFEGTISSISQQLPALLGGAVTGSEGLVLGSMFAQTFGQEYSQGRAQGQDTPTALKRAGLYGAFEVIGEKFGLGERMDMLRNAARGIETNVLAKWMTNTLKHELPGEMLTTTGQFLTDKADGIGLNQNAGIGDYLQQMADTVTQTIMQGGVMSTATGGVNTARQHMNGALDRSRNSELDAGTAQRDAMSKWNTNGLSPRIEPTMDNFSAGLSPEDQQTDVEARAALGLLDDEVPASTLLGAEAQEEQAKVGQKYVRVTKNDGSTGFEPVPEGNTVDAADIKTDGSPTPPNKLPQVWRNRDDMPTGESDGARSEPQDPASMRVSEGPAIEGDAHVAESAAPAVAGKKTKLTPLEHPHLGDEDVRSELQHLAKEAGWEEVGGKMIRADGSDQGSDVVGRTKWIPKAEWYGNMVERLNPDQTAAAVNKALTGEPMTAKEKRVIGDMLDLAKASLDEQRKWHDGVHDEVGATSAEDYEHVAGHADAVEALDEDIPLDTTDPRLTAGDKLTDEELDGIFGIKQSSSVSEKSGPGNASQGSEGTRAPEEAGRGAFQLEGETPEEVKAKTEATEKAKQAEKKAQADADRKAKEEEDAKEIKRRATAAADNFQLGEDPEAALSGQKDIFADAPKIESLVDSLSDQDALNLVSLYRGNGTTKNPASARQTLKEEFQPVDIENGLKRLTDSPVIKADIEARRAPKTEKEAKERREKAKVPRAMTHEGRAVDGKPLLPGDVFKTASGRETTPFPQQKGEKYIAQWVIENAANEAEARGDEFNARAFRAEKPGKNGLLPQASNDAMHEYLFGEQPAVAPSILKPLTEAKSQDDDLDAMFDELLAEKKAEIAGAKPKTEKAAKAKKAKSKKAAEVDPATIKVPPDSLYQPEHKMFSRFAEFTIDTPHGKMDVSLSGATNPAKYEAIYGEPGGIVNVRTPVPGGKSNERAGITYKGVLTQAKAEELARKVIDDAFAGHETKGQDDDLDSMFDELLAEKRAELEAKPQTTARHEMTKAEHRNTADRGKASGLSFAKINLDDESVESLLKNHRADIPALGMLTGAKGGKNLPKMAADIMRVWKLRDQLSHSTHESLMERGLPDLKHLAKEIGIYSGTNKKQLAESIIKWRDDQRTKASDRLQDAKHYIAVHAAVRDGKQVSDKILADYPDLAAEYMPRDSAAYHAAIQTLAKQAAGREVVNALPGMAESYRKDGEKPGREGDIARDIADAIDTQHAKLTAAMNPPKRTAGEAAKSAAKNSAVGFAAAITGLGELFGANINDKASIVEVDETKYQKAAPLFDAAVQHFGQAVVDIRDVMRAVIDAVTEQFGIDVTANMKPYIKRYIAEYREGKRNAPATGTDSEQDRTDDQHEASGRDDSVHGRPNGTGATGAEHGGQVEGKQDAGPAADLVVHDARAPAGGEGRSDGVSEPNGEFVVDRGHSEPGDSEGSGATGSDGTAATDREADGGVSTPDGKSDVKTEQTFAEKVEAQRKAESVPVKVGDKANVDATLPLLLAGQREDVHFAEKRLSQPNGYGVLFANGTGTGKTYLSLGVIKRMVKQGKTNGLVLVPNQEVMNEWLASAPNLGIELHILDDKQDAGEGVSITTYANAGDNMTLLDREHHFVVADEAHMLMASKDANVTKVLDVVRAVTKHHESAHTRARMLHRDLYGKIMTLREQETALLLAREKGMAPIGAAKMLNDIAEELRPLLAEFDVALGHQKAELLETKPEDRPRLLAVSATPFAWEKNVQWAEGYLFNYPQVRRTGAYNEPSPYQKYMMTNFGWHMKNGKLNEPDAKVNRSLMQIQYNMNLRRAGVLSTRMLDVDKDYDRKFVLVDGGIGARIDAALDWLRKEKDGIYSRYYDQANGQFDHLTKRRLLEAIKAKAAIDIIKQHHALGRKVVVFHDFNEGGGFQPFSFPGDPNAEIEIHTNFGASKIKYTHGQFLADFAKAFPDLVGSDLADLKSPIETLREAFPNAMFNNGTEKKRDALQAIKDFNNDEKADANLLVVQSDKNAGWSGHDKTGRYQRVLINLGLPTAPVKSIQIEGRIYRVGQKSDAIFRYLNTGTRFEKFAFATAIATRAETAENLAMGDFARGLKQSYIDAFLESGDYPPSAEDGKGGKAKDRRDGEGMTPFQKAISFYFANQKKNSKTKAQEGVDYYATPEPLGYKMVEWLSPKAGEDYMEPSAGHGAIARWFPENVNLKAIEQSRQLAADLSLNLPDPESVINDTFESHHIGNKYDGIVMNPPFNRPGSTGGGLAMEHIAKAFDHLKEGGRLIAIVPHGPAMDKKIEAWLTGSTTNTRGTTRLNVPDARFNHVVELPITTFLRAGTGVSTRVLIIDRVKGANNGTGKAESTMPLPLDVKHGDINDLFNWLQNMSVPPRAQVAANVSADTASVPELVKELTTPGQQGTIAGVTQHAHGRVVADQSKAVYKVKGDKLETDAPVVKVSTAAGKVLEGVWVPSKDMAVAVDRFTWKPKGEANYFVRIKHVVRPLDDAAFSMGGQEIPAEARMSVGNLAAIVKKHTEQFAEPVPVHILENASTLHLIEPTEAVEGFPKGVTINGKIYLFRNAIENAADARETLFHEMLHFGVRRFLTEQQYIAAMREFYIKDKDIRFAADWFAKGEQGKALRAKGKSMEYIRARGVDEALADLADRVMNNPSGFRNNTLKDKARRELRRFAATVADLFGFKDIADKMRSATNDDARWFIKRVFARLAAGDDANKAFANGYWSDPAYREDSARTVNLHPPVKAKFGLLDTPMRLAFEKTGALAVWRGAFRLLEKTADMALDNKVGEIIKAGLIDRYGLSDAIIERHEEMRVKMIAGVRTADRFLERLSGLTRNEYAVLYAAANNADAAAVDDMIKELPEDSQKALHEIKSLVRDLGQEAVDLKMLDFDTFKANEMAYLHRSYLKHEAELSEGEKANRATRIKGDQFKARGLADIVSSDRLMKWMPGFWGTRVKNGAITSDTIGQQFVRFERRDDPSPTPNLEGIEGEKPMGRLKEVVYWPVGEEIPEKFQDWHVEGEWTVRRTVGKNVVFRRDFTPAERKRMGEIEDIRYAMAKTINIAVHDVEVGKYFAWLAEGHAKLEGELPSGAEVIDDPRKAESRLQTFGTDVWVRVPDTKVKGTQVAAYGKLAGRYVPGPVWTDIRQVGNGAFFTSNVGKGYEKLLKMWKISKTALSPTVHVNNVMANVVMADWHDVGGKHLLQAASAWARKGKDAAAKRLIEDFQDHGGELGTFALTEMQREQLAPILEELLGESRKANDLNGIVNAAGVMSLLREGMVRQAAATLGQSKAGRMAGAIPRKMIDVYQLEDQLFRLAAYIKARESGLTEREAGRFARKSFLDYDIQAPWIVAAKRSGFLPFISFSYRAIPMLYQTVRDKPWKLMKLALVLGAVSAASAAFLGLDDDDEKKERRWLPREKSGKVWGMIPKMVRMPWNTQAGNPVFMDIRRFIPAGDITDLGTSQGAVPLPPFLTVGGPLSLMAELMADKSLFTGKEINESTDTKSEAAIKVLDHIYKWAAPNVPIPTLGTIVPGVESGQFQTYAWSGIAAAARRETSTFGRDQSVPMAVGSALGVKLEGYSVANGMSKAKGEMQHNLTELRKDKAAAKRQFVGGGLSDADYRSKVQKIRDKEIDQKKDFRDRMTK